MDFAGPFLSDADIRRYPESRRPLSEEQYMPGTSPTLLVGFDSAWALGNSGAIVAALRKEDGSLQDLGNPQRASFSDARDFIWEKRDHFHPGRTFILLDQPTIVLNARGQRPVENIVSPSIGRRFGGVQPANTSKETMFGPEAPIWPFLKDHKNVVDPWHADRDVFVLETYPTLALAAFGWLIYDETCKARPHGRLPKYNPQRRSPTFHNDWLFVCDCLSSELHARQLPRLATFVDHLRTVAPRKSDQDQIDALICLLVGVQLVGDNGCCVVGSVESGLMVLPHNDSLKNEFLAQCRKTERNHALWIREVRH